VLASDSFFTRVSPDPSAGGSCILHRLKTQQVQSSHLNKFPLLKIVFVIVMPSIHNTAVVALAAAHHILTVPKRRKKLLDIYKP
jgi:hypothetical protein